MPWYPRCVARAAMVRLRLLWPDGQVGERLPISQWLIGNLSFRTASLILLCQSTWEEHGSGREVADLSCA